MNNNQTVVAVELTCLWYCAQAVIEQVRHDHALLKERVARLGGPKATARLEAGLAAARAAALAQASSAPSTPSASPNGSPAKASSGSGSVPASPEAVPNSPVAGAPVEVDENERMTWELLYNLQWQLPTEELEAGWKDATGETSVMKVWQLLMYCISASCKALYNCCKCFHVLCCACVKCFVECTFCEQIMLLVRCSCMHLKMMTSFLMYVCVACRSLRQAQRTTWPQQMWLPMCSVG